MCARLCLQPVAGFFACGHRWLAENDFPPVALDGFRFHGRRIPWHDDPGCRSAPGRRASHRSAMISARLRDDSIGYLRVSQRKDGVDAPRILNEPVFCKLSHLKKSRAPAMAFKDAEARTR